MKILVSAIFTTLILSIIPNHVLSQISTMDRLRSDRMYYKRYKELKESGKDVRSYWRISTNFSFPMGSADYSSHYVNPSKSIDTSFSVKGLKLTGFNFGGIAETYFPVSSMGDDGVIGIGFMAIQNYRNWDTGPIHGGPQVDYRFTFNSFEMSFPLTLDFIFGSEAALDKSKKYGFKFGVGVIPRLSLTQIDPTQTLGVVNDKSFVLRPFVKAEVAMFAGICFKLNFTYTMGNIPYMNAPMNFSLNDNDVNNIKLSSKGSAALSLGFFPFSYDWDRSQWWRK